MKVHPIANLFPMMSDDELADLAADIKANGLVHPVVTADYADTDGEIEEVLIDGRNRMAACELAGVKPTFTKLHDQDPASFIFSVNLARRNLSKGQKAMATAFIYPEAEKGGRGKKTNSLETSGFSQQRLSQARSVLAYSRELAQQVLSGTTPLDEALKVVRDKQKEGTTKEAKLARLRAEAPDLADLVEEERLPLNDAIAALDDRIRERERARRTATDGLHTIFNALHPRSAKPREWAHRFVRDVDPVLWPDSAAAPLSKQSLKACADTMLAIAESWKED